MVAARQDAWSEDDDLLLAEVTLRHIREGGTQLSAFEEVGDKLNRTAAACGFRWNSLVRKKYEAAIQIAKAQRQKRNYQKPPKQVETNYREEFSSELNEPKIEIEEAISFDSVIRFIKNQKNVVTDLVKLNKKLEKEIDERNKELDILKAENKEMKNKLNYVETDYQIVNEDYKALIQIMDRARRMAFLTNEEQEAKPVFKMDSNGNLERVDK